MDMVESVARALARHNYPGGSDRDIDEMWGGWTGEARAAIAAMREVSEPMRHIGGRIVANLSSGRAIDPYEDDAVDAYQAMIDAALGGTDAA